MSEEVFRIQDRDGRGPFKPGFSHRWVEERSDHENLIPWTEQFGNIGFGDNENIGCACKTTDQLKRWFTKKEYNKLKRLGYRSVKIQADRIIAESDIQCVFGRIKPLNQNIKPFKLY